MPRPLAHTLNALVAAFALVLISSAFAQTKPPSMVGLSRDQIVAQLGEPKSNIKAGTREVLFFDHWKVTLRNNVVVETEAIEDEPAPAKRPTVDPATGAATVPGQAPAQPAANNSSTPPAPAPDATGAKPPGGDATTSAKSGDSLAIKFIKSGGAKSAARPAPAPATTPPSTPAAPTSPAQTPPAAVADSRPAPPATPPAAKETLNPPLAGAKPAVAPTQPTVMPDAARPTVVEEISQIEPVPAKPAVDPRKKAAIRRRWRLRRDAEDDDDSPQIFSIQTYIIAVITIAAGGVFLWWRRNQRNLELAATAVSRMPFESASAGTGDTAGMFSAELIGKLGPKKFERLVASYYAKTGVVAERTNAGPESPVHIKIFWKGEPKPFAGVQCHANPPMLIGPKPLMELFTALSTADIRRGYVVTTGKFNVEARDLAEEKHFTLLPGDIFLEKLNALPPAARGELLKETNTEEPAPAAGAATSQ